MNRKFLARSVCAAALVTGCTLAVAGPARADASSEQYRACDGYGAASDGGDGMTSVASVLLIFNPPGYGNTARGTTGHGSDAIAACDAALADVPAKHWMRRVSLLRARGLHRLDNNDTAGALADFDLADAAAKDANDAFYARSLGFGVQIARAFTFHKMGEQAKAETLALQTMAIRPYNRQAISSAAIAMGIKASDAAEDAVERSLSRLNPVLIDAIFLRNLQARKFPEAISLYSQLVPPHEIGRANLYGTERAGREWRDFRTKEMFWASRSSGYAYALAATGKNDEARAALQAARDRLVADTIVPTPPSDKELKDRTKAALYQGEVDIRTVASTECTKLINNWSAMVEKRIAVNEGKGADVLKSLDADTLTHGWATADLVASAKPRVNPAAKAAKPTAAKPDAAKPVAVTSPIPPVSNTITTQDAVPAKEIGLDQLFRALPEAETPDRVSPYQESRKPWLAMEGSPADIDEEGYRVTPPDDKGVQTVSFRGIQGTLSMVEEMALLRCAELARRAGKRGIIIVGREDTRFTVNTTYYGSTIRTDPNGQYTKLSVVFVDPANLPPEFAGNGWRVIDADEAYNALAPIYIPPPKVKTR